MLHFECDYMAGAHPDVMELLSVSNMVKTPGYGADRFCEDAALKILEACGCPDGEVHFLEGGTQTNLLVITRLLDYSDGVVAADTAHIAVHEAGAIESAGHKVITLKGVDGKLIAEDVERCLEEYDADDTREHIVRPGMVYITFPTELGTVYSRDELTALYNVCRRHSIPLYIDGARLAYGLAVTEPDLTLTDIAHLCDVFYIGGTKCGALFGEAVVATRRGLLPRFFSLCKQRGAVLAKGKLLGLQFSRLFDSDGLYMRIGRHAVKMAMDLRSGMRERGFKEYIVSPTNQQFFVLPNSLIEKLRPKVGFGLWGPMRPTATPVRFVTDWSTTADDISDFFRILDSIAR